MAWKFTSDKAIFIQIVDIIKHDIVSGKFKSGDKLPTVRDLSIIAGVNPNTVQRAYAEIEMLGLIYTKRGDGRYVCEDVNIIKNQAQNELQATVANFLKTVIDLGFNKEEVLKELEKEAQKGEK